MSLLKVGFIGYRGMVGSVLLKRMREENDFAFMEVTLFSSSQSGQAAPSYPNMNPTIMDANNLKDLCAMDVLVSTQGGEYTTKIIPKLRQKENWKGYWVDAASTLRMSDDALIILDPINGDDLRQGLKSGIKNYIGGNCTVSLMLLALQGLFKRNHIQWVSSQTYQAASGAGAKNIMELFSQMGHLHHKFEGRASAVLQAGASSDLLLDFDRDLSNTLRCPSEGPTQNFGHYLACNILPWIDVEWENGQSKEEWKAMAEANKILKTKTPIPVDGTCVRVSAMRSHSQALTIKLNQNIPLDEIESMLKESHQWFSFVPNKKPETLSSLTPVAVSGSLNIAVGRVRKMNLGPEFLNVFTVGDQLLWGAAEPLRRMLHLILEESRLR